MVGRPWLLDWITPGHRRIPEAMNPTTADEKQVHLRDYWRVAWHGKWMVLAIAVVVVTLGDVATFSQTPNYPANVARRCDTSTRRSIYLAGNLIYSTPKR